ncbi:hypothetical protein SLEP1_g53657 [Rubroshorea leprosula]|uniref:Uncharacterized protein n=1 Tax=Rubroshorea leprosula TaxID=152421 RepID=A0AAV5MA50_9ROSI|nr:hypothetical protein SLEP1_g53657 [Rubroshorea leprosula]
MTLWRNVWTEVQIDPKTTVEHIPPSTLGQTSTISVYPHLPFPFACRPNGLSSHISQSAALPVLCFT